MKRPDIAALLGRSSLLMVARLGGGVVAFAGSMLIARSFGADALGIVALCMAVASLLALMASEGRQAVAPLFVARYLEHDRPDLIRGFIKAGHGAIRNISLLAAGVVLAALLIWGDAFSAETAGVVAVSCLAAPAIALINFNGAVLVGCRRQILGLAPDLLLKPLLVLVAVVAVVALGPASPVLLLGGICAAFWATAGLQALLIHRRRLFPGQPPDMGDSAQWHRTATPWIAIVLLADYLVELHLLLASWMLAPALVGILHVCFRLRMLASFGMRALYSLILPDVYAAHARGDGLTLARDITRGNALVLLYASGVCVVVAGVGDTFLMLFGDEFTAGYGALVICCLSMIPRAVFGPATAVMAAVGRQAAMIVILLAAVGLSALTILHTAPAFALQSVALGYTAAVTFAAVAQWWWTLRTTGIDCSIFALATYRLAGAGPKTTVSPIAPRQP